MKSRSMTGAGGTAEVDGAGRVAGAGVAGAGAAGAGAAGAGAAEGLRDGPLFADAAAPVPVEVVGLDAVPAGRTFGAAAARALAQLARLGASSLGAGVSAFAIVAV